MQEVRCPGKLRFVITDEGLWEVKCHSFKCGASKEVVVLHYYDPATGELTKTKKYRDAKILFEQSQTKKENYKS
jgi:hypothetical protein